MTPCARHPPAPSTRRRLLAAACGAGAAALLPPTGQTAPTAKALATAIWIGAAGMVCAQAPAPAGPAEFQGADLALGEKLIRQNQCSDCHVKRLGGDGSTIYRPLGRISTPAKLLTMVEVCNTELNLGLFPDDVAAIAAVLQRDHYRFK